MWTWIARNERCTGPEMRTGTSAHLQGSAAAGCADLPVRNWTSCQAGMRTGTSAHLPGFGGGEVRGPPGPQLDFVPGRNADGDVRAPPRVRRRRGARTSRSAIVLRAKWGESGPSEPQEAPRNPGRPRTLRREPRARSHPRRWVRTDRYGAGHPRRGSCGRGPWCPRLAGCRRSQACASRRCRS